MRTVVAWLLIGCLAGAGCAEPSSTIEIPTGRAAQVMHRWDAVLALPFGQHVVLSADGGVVVDGAIGAVTASSVQVIRKAGDATVFDRAAVVRVVRVGTRAAQEAKTGLVIGVALGGLLTAASHGFFWFTLFTDPAMFAGMYAIRGAMERRQVLVYERMSGEPRAWFMGTPSAASVR